MNGQDTKADPFDTRKVKKPDTFCIFCGLPLTRQEVGLTVSDQRAADWDAHEFVQVSFHACVPCKKERLQWLADGLRGADERKAAYAQMTAKSQDFT
jgi:hypothetical protein